MRDGGSSTLLEQPIDVLGLRGYPVDAFDYRCAARASLRFAQRRSSSTQHVDSSSRPPNSMRFSLSETASAIAEAMLAGSPEADGVASRVTSVLGEFPQWAHEVTLSALRCFGGHWATIGPDQLSSFIARSPVFVVAWASDAPPRVARILLRAPEQRPLPPSLQALALPQLPTSGELARWLGLIPAELEWLADRWRVMPDSSGTALHHYTYRTFEKRDGGCRLVEIPKRRLRNAQRQILRGLLDHVPPHDAAHGFRKGRGIVTFAAPHKDRDVVIRFDLADFFVSVNAARVNALFNTLGYPTEVCRALTALCTNRIPSRRLREPDLQERLDSIGRQRYRTRHLPQGSPTSPALANLCAFRLDTRLAALAASLGATYTRYADDLAFSGNGLLAGTIDRLHVSVGAIVIEEGFTLRWRKTRVMRRGVRQQLAGVVINRHTNLARAKFDALKATLTNCTRYGPASQNHHSHPDFRAFLAGQIAHATMLNESRGARLRQIFDEISWDVEQYNHIKLS